MKRLSLLIILFASASSCQQKNLGPEGEVTENGTGGFWKLSEYTIRGKSLSLSEVESQAFVETQSKIVTVDDHPNSFIFSTGTTYNIFRYSKTPPEESVSVNGVKWDHNYNPKAKQETCWYRIDDNSGFLLILNVDRSTATSSRMEISNIIKSSKYESKLDTIRYTYKPTPAWF